MTVETLDLQVDGDGFVCVVAPDTYEGFVHADWTLDSLLARFVEQMNRGSLFIAYPGPDDADRDLAFETVPPKTGAGRAASGTVQVGPAGLWLTDYTQLTMAAQFSDESSIASYSQRLPVAPGQYHVTLHEEITGDESTFTLTVSPANPDDVVQQLSVPWFD
jgi:hypothetical protein